MGSGIFENLSGKWESHDYEPGKWENVCYECSYPIRGLPLFTGPAGYEKIGKDHEAEGPHLGRTMKQ